MLLQIPDVLTPDQLAHARQLLETAAWTDGRVTAGYQSGQVKSNLQLPETEPAVRELRRMMLEVLGANPQFFSAALPLRILPPFFNRYEGGGNFGFHIDNAIRYDHSGGGLPQAVRTDLSATLFFSDPDEYDGGELVIEDTYGQHRVKLPAGHMVLYPGTSLHQVTPVTRGTRLASFFWIQSMVRDAGQRRLMFDMDRAIQQLNVDVPQHPSVVQLIGVYHNLLRQWGDV